MSKTQKAKENIEKIIVLLKKRYPESRCSLHYSTPWELLVATILSAQCTDKRVNQVTASLFEKYSTVNDYAEAPLKEIESAIRSTGFYHNKARTIQQSAQVIVEKYGGNVPHSLQELIQLPGVGRKTANVVLGNAFDIPGIVVDTHVKRITYRLGLTSQTDPVKIEQELSCILPPEEWSHFGHLLIDLGRDICKARKPECHHCPLIDFCQQQGVK